MCYFAHMDITIRNLQGDAYREAKARAALEGKTVGEVVSEALRAYLQGSPRFQKDRSLAELQPASYGPRSRNVSREIDRIVYGLRR